MVNVRERPSNLKLGWTVGKLAGRRLIGARVGSKDLELGDLLTDQLDEMKGLAMKLGQIVSYMDVPLPEAVQQRLARLQTGVVGLSPQRTLDALRAALGEDVLSRFEEFEIEPFAAASIGQVHRAKYGGRKIVLKLQYPDAARGFENDLGALGKVASLASLASAVDGSAIVRELGERLSEECDYLREASAEEAFRAFFSADPRIVVPEVVSEFSTSTTLATVYCEGVPSTEAVKFPDAVRRELAHALVRFSYRSLLQGCAIQADPHPGNFKFQSDGRLVCLDFGCVKIFDEPFVAGLRQIICALESSDRALFRSAVLELGMAPRPKKFDFEHHFSMMEHLHRPLLSKEFHFTPAFVKTGLAYNGPSSPNARTMNMPPAYVWVARLQWGLWSLLTRLDARVALRPLLDEMLSFPMTPIQLSASFPKERD